MEPVDVFPGINAFDDRSLVDLRRQRQLDEDAMHTGVGVEAIDDLDQLNLRHVGGKAQHVAIDAGGPARPFLVADVDLAGRDVADQNGRQARGHSVFGHEARDVRGNFAPNLICKGFSVENPSGHGRTPSASWLSSRLS